MRHKALDGWRGIGAMAVAVLHFKATGFLNELPPLNCLTLSVDFFFVLSGFVIARVYSDELSEGGSPTAFAIRRFGRLWPLHVFLLTALIAIEVLKLVLSARAGHASEFPPFSAARDPGMILPNLLLVQAFLSPSELSWNYPSWSISAEFWTYLLFAFVVIAGPVQRGSRLGVFAGLALAAWLAVLVGAPDGMETTGNYAIARCLTGFFSGAVVERLYAGVSSRRFSSGRLELLAAGAAVLLIIAATIQPEARLAAPIVFGFLVLAHADDGGALSSLLCSWRLQWLGKLSYSIYMTHALLLAYVMPRVSGVVSRVLNGYPRVDELVVSLFFVSLLLGFSYLTYRLIELPGQRAFASLARNVAAPLPITR